MDLCGPMRTESINGKKYVLVIVDDYTRFGWVRFLCTKDETPHVIEKFIVKTQRALNATAKADIGKPSMLPSMNLRRSLTLFKPVKRPEPPSVPPTKKQVEDLFQWFDDDEVIPPPAVPIPSVNAHAAQAIENAIGSPSTKPVYHEGALKLTKQALEAFDAGLRLCQEENHGFERKLVIDFGGIHLLELLALEADQTSSFSRSSQNNGHYQSWTGFTKGQLVDPYTIHEERKAGNHFLPGLQVSQNPIGIFINQSKYAQEILKKFGFDTCTPIDTPMAERPDLDEDKGGKLIDPTRFCGMLNFLDIDLLAGHPKSRKVPPSPLQKLNNRPIRMLNIVLKFIWDALSTTETMDFTFQLNSDRTASIWKSDTSVLEDLKALSWKTCQEGSLLNLSDHRAVVRLPEPKRKNLGEKCIDCIFIGYAKHSKAYRFYVIEPNEHISVNSVIESRDAMFAEKRFTSIPRPKSLMPSSNEDQIGETPVESPIVRRSNRSRVAKSFGSNFQLYFVEGSRDEKEAINDEKDSIMENNTWILYNLPPGCKPLGCKWILKRKMKVDGTIVKFKARLVIQGFRQKEGIDYFDTYASVARIFTIRLLITLATTYNLVIHQMDVKTTMAPKQWHQKFDEVVLSSGFVLNQSDKCVYCKFDKSSNGVIIYLYVDDMLIFGTEQVQVDKLKEFLLSNFSMKDMGEDNVILGIRIKREDKGITITQSHYIKKILKKFKCDDCCPVSTPLDPTIKLMPNTGRVVDQLEYSRAIGCLMYEMISTRPDIAYAMGKLSR
ncbi:zinc finger, CCHC-type containing protein [Tanacetum coccineum]